MTFTATPIVLTPFVTMCVYIYIYIYIHIYIYIYTHTYSERAAREAAQGRGLLGVGEDLREAPLILYMFVVPFFLGGFVVTQRVFPSSSWPGCPVFAPEVDEEILQRLWAVWPVTRSVYGGEDRIQSLPLPSPYALTTELSGPLWEAPLILYMIRVIQYTNNTIVYL